MGSLSAALGKRAAAAAAELAAGRPARAREILERSLSGLDEGMHVEWVLDAASGSWSSPGASGLPVPCWATEEGWQGPVVERQTELPRRRGAPWQRRCRRAAAARRRQRPRVRTRPLVRGPLRDQRAGGRAGGGSETRQPRGDRRIGAPSGHGHHQRSQRARDGGRGGLALRQAQRGGPVGSGSGPCGSGSRGRRRRSRAAQGEGRDRPRPDQAVAERCGRGPVRPDNPENRSATTSRASCSSWAPSSARST